MPGELPTPLTSTQKRALLAAALGWGFDGLDGYLYIAVASQLVTNLVKAADPGLADAALRAAAAERAAWIQAAFFIGWACGGALFGRLGDRIGRSRTLALTILTYAVFTGLGFFATQWWHLLVFRFLAALGIGGEWAAGSALVSETLPPRCKAWASALLQSGYIVGIIAATLTGGLLKDHDPRWVFVIGVVPALFVYWIRRNVPEPQAWHAAKALAAPARVTDLFSRSVLRTTLVLSTFVSLCLVTVWIFIFFTPQVIRSLPAVKTQPPPDQVQTVTVVTLIYFTANIAGNFLATYLSRLIGARLSFAAMLAVACASLMLGYFAPSDVTVLAVYASLFALCGLGLFAIFPLYIPPQFPTLLRTLGAGFSYNLGRLACAAGTVYAGTIAASAGGPARAVFYAAFLTVPALALCALLPHDRNADGPSATR
ncbi:MAG TPA: MFS transporter [Phycisphaerales bacterium]|nr:MFS transporter [Phycisphaerales bacterium]